MKIRKIKDISEHTKCQYARLWNRFEKWCEDNAYPSIPTNSKVLADFIRHKEYCSSHSASYISAIRYMHAQKSMEIQGCCEDHQAALRERKIAGKSPGKYDNFRYLRNYKNRFTNEKKIGMELLESVVSKIPKDIAGLRDRAMILLRFFSGLQNICNIEVTQLRFSSTSVVFQNVFRSSRQQFGTMILPSNASQNLCPVKALKEWIDAAKITDGFLWRNLHRKLPGTHAASSRLLNIVVKKHFGDGFSCGNMDKEEVTGEFC